MLNKKSIREVDVKGKRIIMRADFNVPLDKDNRITDDTRIVSALPTIQFLIDSGAKVILLSHLGRPKGEPNLKFSLKPVAKALSGYLHRDVIFVSEERVVGQKVKEAVAQAQEGDVVLLENVRFRKEETENNVSFSKELADLGEFL